VSAGHHRWGGFATHGRPHIGLILLSLAFVALALLYAAYTPLYEGPDSGGHFGYIAYLREQHRLPPLDLPTANFSHELVQQPPFYYTLAALLTPSGAISPALQLNVPNPYYQLGLSKRASVSLPEAPAGATVALWIARLVSILGGLLTLIGTWLLARELFPASPTVALAVAAATGLNPQFLFTAANISNDAWCAATVTLAVWLALYCVRRRVTHPLGWLAVGALAGLAALTKYSGLMVALPLALVLLPHAWRRGWPRGVFIVLLSGAGALLTAGFWYARNLALWGEAVPLRAMLAVLPGLARDVAPTAAELWQAVRWLARSYWGVFGYGVLSPQWYYQLTAALMVVAAAGLAFGAIRPQRWSGTSRRAALLLALCWFGGVFASLLNWMRLVRFTDQGRLLFAAAPAVSCLLVLGWAAWLPRRGQAWLYQLVPVVFAALALAEAPVLVAAYRTPPLSPPAYYDRTFNADFAAGMTLLGADLPAGAGINAHGEMPITLYFRARQNIGAFYTLFLHLTDDDNHMLYQFDGVPFGGRHPTRQWRPGEVFADSYMIRVGDLPADGLATLSLGFYTYNDPAQRQTLAAGAQSGTDRVILGRVRLHGQNTTANAAANRSSSAALATWANGIQLTAVHMEGASEGAPHAAALDWHAQKPVQEDYTVSVQVLNAQGVLVAQTDQPPGGGRDPTSTWRAGDDVPGDRYELTGAPADWSRVIVLLYDQTGRRLPLLGAPARDTFVIAEKGAH
jgi:4-amino-4-deoxy-L-arabinose transferase-like glycosyltransferase